MRRPSPQLHAPLVAGALLVAGVIAMAATPEHPQAVAARQYASYTPADSAVVVAQVAKRDPREVAMRHQLQAQPARVDLAVQLARTDIQRSRTLSDPRYLGRAQATLTPWWSLVEPPPDVLLMRATIRQSLHDFVDARADLDRLVQLRPGDVQAQLTRAVVATVTADYATARASCERVAELADPLVATTCAAPVDAITGQLPAAYDRLVAALAGAPAASLDVQAWALSTLAELSVMRGDYAAAGAQFKAVLDFDPDDAYSRAGLADVLLWTGKPAEASALVAGRESIDNLLVRRAIAEHAAAGPAAARWTQVMRDRIAAAAERGDRIHLREEARFTLEVGGDAPRALALALEDWGVQKELADARLVAAAAVAAGDLAAAEPVRLWMRTNRVVDDQLSRSLGPQP